MAKITKSPTGSKTTGIKPTVSKPAILKTSVSKKGNMTRNISATFRRIKMRGIVEIDEKTQSLKFSGKGTALVQPVISLENASAFTVETVVTPNRLKKVQYILESQNPPVRINLEPDGTIIGSIHTDKGWESVSSEKRKIVAGESVQIRLVRDDTGELSLEVNDHHVKTETTSKVISPLGSQGTTIGGDSSGKNNLFNGTVEGVRFRKGAVSGAVVESYETKASQLAEAVKADLTYTGKVVVVVDPGEVDDRFNPIRAIMKAAGVDDVSTLSTLTINQPTVIVRNQIMIAPPKVAIANIDWAALANAIAVASPESAVHSVATMMPNRNSKEALRAIAASAVNAGDQAAMKEGVGVKVREVTDKSVTKNVKGAVISSSGKTLLKGIDVQRPTGLLLRQSTKVLSKSLMGEMIKPIQGIEIVDSGLFDKLEGENPGEWPAFTLPNYLLYSITTIPVNSSVIIAGRLDLTNQTLMVEPDVEKLYIIAEEIVGAPNATITWRRPDGSTPGRLDDPDKNGRSYSGVQTGNGSRNGLPGEDGLDGDPGFTAANGIDAPNLEVWVKHLTAMPDIDLNGEDGIKGGTGQRGGRGGNGARGAGGEWYWFFGIHCWTHPGHGGNGGDGGRGGRGGPGGDGGHGGEVAIGVLEGTLASSVQARAFKIKNQGGQAGHGGDGGQGGYGGNGGTHGNDYHDGEEVCRSGVDGTHGAQGQPGSVGNEGRIGSDGTLRFFEFTEESWNEQLTRPWLYELTPTEAFPGDVVTVTGTRFADTDRVIIDGVTYMKGINPDESISFVLSSTIGGGEKDLFVRRQDGDESNHLRIWIKPRLDTLPTEIPHGSEVTITGLAFLNNAKVMYNEMLVDAIVDSQTILRFIVPGTGGVNTAETDVSIAVRNPDGMTSNVRTATVPRTLDCGFRIGVHDFSFDNFAAGSPSWGTFEDTFGSFEVWHEALDPIFGHPILTAAFYAFYHYFLLGRDNGGLATGFCTSMSAVVLDEFYTGSHDTHTRYTLDGPTRDRLTAIHGRLLSRESLLDFHDQGRRGTANVETVFRQIEASLRDGAGRESALMLFFVPSGDIWDGGYFDKLSSTHCIVPIKIVYPVGHDGTSIAGVKLYCWDCNHPVEEGEPVAKNCRLEFRNVNGEIRFDYFDGGGTTLFTSEGGITIASMTNGKYLLSDHDLPYSGPFGLTTFIIDFLLSPADLLVEDSSGRHTGMEGGNILAEIPNSHPGYLVPNFYMLPANQAMTRRIIGNGSGNYAYHSIMPDGTSISLENVATNPGEEDVLAINSDASQVRFTPGALKSFRFNLARDVGNQVRAVSVEGVVASPMAAIDMTISPDLSIVRVGNRESTTNVNVHVSVYVKEGGSNTTVDRNNVSLPNNNDLLVTVTSWDDLALTVRALPFQV